MEKKLLHTPEGVRDIYNVECENKLYLQDEIHKTIKLYGYNDIQTPTFEFFDIFNKEKGSAHSKNLYKFFDRDGYTLVLRPDMTPSIARAAAKYYMDEDMPVRFCYMGNTFINNAEHQGKLKETTHIGAELIGDNKSDADAEIIAITIDSLLRCGLKDFQIEIGHADYFKGLIEAANIDEDTTAYIRELLANKNYFGVEEAVSEMPVPEAVKNAFMKLSELVGSIDVINEAKKLVSGETIDNALDRLEKVYNILKVYGYDKYISFDLGMVSDYQYYTGVVFRAYTYKIGDPIAKGGRYDDLLKQFGKNSPSIGFCINIDNLLVAMQRQKLSVGGTTLKHVVLYDNDVSTKAIELAFKLRSDNIKTELIRKSSKFTIEDYIGYESKNSVSTIHYVTVNETKTFNL
ncbi:MAG: ATP phosphoribosyltransferase regulatory subunit [Lachnospiraceae bacterium]|nr:ATP phosphoribosyltransferase regulatory subunit [Lachnospiraceae bacterium]MDE6698475.1 ATP phosphoribosyltransferase regulatory subunit [Lachnospiraceae bacterium]